MAKITTSLMVNEIGDLEFQICNICKDVFIMFLVIIDAISLSEE